MTDIELRPVAVIDPSLAGLYLMIEGPNYPVKSLPLYTNPKDWPKTLEGRMRRMVYIAKTISTHLKKSVPALLIIEGYSFASRSSSTVTLGELGGIIRDRCVGYADIAVEVAPGTIKKFATGKGNANKIAVATALTARYGQKFSDDNEADAFGMMRLGQAVLGYETPTTAFQREAVETVKKQIEQETL